MADAAANLKALLMDLEEKREKELHYARWSHWLNVGAMVLTLITAGVAVVYGLIPGHSAQVTTGLALVPGGIALLARSLKLEPRCNWHYRKHHAINALVRQASIEMPDPPTQELVTEISKTFSKLEIESEAAWEKSVSFDWDRFEKK
jgi:hypothetical protein